MFKKITFLVDFWNFEQIWEKIVTQEYALI